MIKKILSLGALALVALVGVTTASAVSGQLTSTTPEQREGTPANDAPEIAARAAAADGQHEHGVKVYRNRSGVLCMVEGEVAGNRVGAHAGGRFQEAPYSEGATCGLQPRPVAFAMTRTGDETVLHGVADSQVRSIAVSGDGVTKRVAPQSQGAFIVTLAGAIDGEVNLEVEKADGSTKSITIPARPSFEDLSERARRYAPRPDGSTPEQPHTK